MNKPTDFIGKDVEWKTFEGRRKRGYVVSAMDEELTILGEDDNTHHVYWKLCHDIGDGDQ